MVNDLLIYAGVPLISLLAFFLKGVTGTGTTTVIVALAVFIVSPKSAVILASFINIFGGLLMLGVDPVPLKWRFVVPVVVMMGVGSFTGGLTLTVMSSDHFRLVLGVVFMLAGIWFGLRPFMRSQKGAQLPPPPERPSAADLGVGTVSGFLGGFVGINAPPLMLHFGRVLDKRHLRRFLVLIFIPANIVQTATYWYYGALTREIVMLGLLMIPTMLAGIYLGSRVHARISESTFGVTLGLLIVFVSITLIWRSIYQ